MDIEEMEQLQKKAETHIDNHDSLVSNRDKWILMDALMQNAPELIAAAKREQEFRVLLEDLWHWVNVEHCIPEFLRDKIQEALSDGS